MLMPTTFTREDILQNLPYAPPFRFVDEIVSVDETKIVGTYRFKEDEFFYAGHFPGKPITPGVILIETMAQIGLVAYGMYLSGDWDIIHEKAIAFSSSNVNFYRMVLPGDRVTVTAEMEFFRLRKIQCRALMVNTAGKKVCEGTLSGMILRKRNS